MASRQGNDTRYKIRQKAGWCILNIKESMHSDTDITWLLQLIEGLAQKGNKKVAINFEKETYLYSKLISVLIACSKCLRKDGGVLAILEPSKHIAKILTTLNLIDSVIKVYDSEAALP